MTKGELLDLIEYLDDDVEIRFASQPSWPFEYDIDGGVEIEDEENNTTIFYLEEGRQIGYLPGNVKNELGW